MTKKLKVVIIDDNDIFREGLRFFIENKTDWEIIQEETSGGEFLKQNYKQQADVILLDINMLKLNGIDTVVQYFDKNAPTPTKVLAITSHLSDFQLQRLIVAGFSGYILKKDIYKYLKEAVEQVIEGRVYFHQYINKNNFNS